MKVRMQEVERTTVTFHEAAGCEPLGVEYVRSRLPGKGDGWEVEKVVKEEAAPAWDVEMVRLTVTYVRHPEW